MRLHVLAGADISTPSQLKSMAEVQDHCVPVRLELDHEQHRFSDTFMWNCSGEQS